MTATISLSWYTYTACPHLENPINGVVNVSTLGGTAIATYSCDNGYVIDGQFTRTCRAAGQWSGHIPVCTSKFISFIHVNPILTGTSIFLRTV